MNIASRCLKPRASQASSLWRAADGISKARHFSASMQCQNSSMPQELSHVSKQDLIHTTPNVGGGWGAELSDTYEVLNPATGASIIRMSSCGREQTEAAIKEAHSAFAPWSKTSAFDRSEVLMRWRELITANQEDIARIMTLECGKPLQEARNEITAGIGSLTWFADEAVRVTGQVLQPTGPNKQMITLKQPVGVVGAITPWNFPFSMITRKVAPAIACGCTVVLKPSEQTPLTAYALVHLAREAGLPDGVFNIVSGNAKEIGEAMLSSEAVRKIGFTGSTKVGKYLMERSAETVKRVSMELGGNAPFIVFDDADLQAAAKAVVASGLRNAGQTCVCANRILVQESVHDELSQLVTEQMQQVKVGNGLDSDSTMGPCINQAQADFAQEHVDDAVQKGASVLCGGSKPEGLGKGFFFSPTLLGDATRDMRVYKEETFAPVIPLFKFKTQAEAIEMANDTPYGLAAYFFSRDLSRVWHVASQLEYGMIGVNETAIVSPNAPFGGVKQSGLGREHGESGIYEFLEEKFVAMGLQSSG